MTFIEKLAVQHNVKVVFKKYEDTDAFVMGRTIFLNPELYEPRLNWHFCHELAHIILGHSLDSISRQNEKDADEYAAELMLPETDFRPLVNSISLVELKETFPHASWEVISRRLIRYYPAVLTIFDDRKLTYRGAPDGYAFPVKPTKQEWNLVGKCFDQCCHMNDEAGELIMSGYFIDEGRCVKRVLLLTRVND